MFTHNFKKILARYNYPHSPADGR